MNERPKIGIGVIILKDNKVLMLKRKNAHGAGSWSFPGGHLEFNEGIVECARREVMEETGITIKNLRYGPFTNDIFESEGKHYVTLYLIAEHDSGEARIMEPHKSDGLGWFEWGSLPDPLFIPVQNLLKIGFKPILSLPEYRNATHPSFKL
jgi:8-oxo-dGTP diphosphatase